MVRAACAAEVDAAKRELFESRAATEAEVAARTRDLSEVQSAWARELADVQGAKDREAAELRKRCAEEVEELRAAWAAEVDGWRDDMEALREARDSEVADLRDGAAQREGEMREVYTTAERQQRAAHEEMLRRVQGEAAAALAKAREAADAEKASLRKEADARLADLEARLSSRTIKAEQLQVPTHADSSGRHRHSIDITITGNGEGYNYKGPRQYDRSADSLDAPPSLPTQAHQKSGYMPTAAALSRPRRADGTAAAAAPRPSPLVSSIDSRLASLGARLLPSQPSEPTGGRASVGSTLSIQSYLPKPFQNNTGPAQVAPSVADGVTGSPTSIDTVFQIDRRLMRVSQMLG